MKKKYIWLLIGLIITGIGSITIISMNPAFANNEVENINSQYRFYYNLSPAFSGNNQLSILNIIIGICTFILMLRIVGANLSKDTNGYTLCDKCKLISILITIISAVVIFTTTSFNCGFENIVLANVFTIFLLTIMLAQFVLIRIMGNEISVID